MSVSDGQQGRRLEVLRSIAIVSVSAYVVYLLGLLVNIWIARTLGPEGFGHYAFTIWLCGWLIVCCNHALPTSATKFVAEADGSGAPGVAAGIAGWLNRLQHGSTLFVLVLFVLVTWLLRPTEWGYLSLPALVLVVVAVAAKADYGIWVGIEKGQERFEPDAITTVAGGVVNFVLVVIAWLAHAGLLTFIAIYTVASLLLNLFNRFAYRRFCRPFHAALVPADTGRRLKRHLRQTAMLVLLNSFRGGTIEIFLLTTFSTSAEVGYFAIAMMLTRNAVKLFSVGLTTTLLPYMAKSYGENGQQKAAHFLGEATRFYWAAGVAIAGLGWTVTPQVVGLFYGTRYLEAIPAVRAILVMSGLMLIGTGIAAFQTVLDRQHERVWIMVATVVATLVLGIVLIPELGLSGAVATTVGAGLVQLALSIYCLRRTTCGGMPVTIMLRLFLVGLLVTAVAGLVLKCVPGHFGFIPASLVFLVLYWVASVRVRYWNEGDYMLMGAIAKRFGRLGRVLMYALNRLDARAPKPTQ